MGAPSRSLVSLLALFVASALAARAEKPRPETTVREEARVTVIEVPVTVVDKNGHPVENLTAEDFEITDDGKKQPVTGFEVLDERQPQPIPAAGENENPVNPAARRHFLILFDLSFGSPKAIVNARKAAHDFVVNRMKELDLASVATYSTEQGLRLLVSFTGDRTQLAAAIDTLGFPTLADRSPDPLSLLITPPTQSNSVGLSAYTSSTAGAAQSQSDSVLQDMLENLDTMHDRSQRAMYRDRVTRLLESFAKMARTLDAVPGRKHILYLSEGFDSRELDGSALESGGARQSEWVIQGQSWKVDSDTRFGNSGLQSRMSSALALFNRSDCVIHAIDIGGLRAASDASGSANNALDGQEALFYFSDQTGGEFLRNANDLANSFDRLLERTGLIYLLAFQPVRVPENGKFHTLKVTVKNKSWRVSHRTGYYEPKSEKTLSPVERKLAMSEAVAAAIPRTDIPAWVLAAPVPAGGDAARVPVIVEVPGDRLLKGHTAPKMNVDLFVYAIDRKGQTRDHIYQPVGIDLKLAESRLAKAGLKFYGELTLPSGQYTLRTLVREDETGRFGVTVTPLNVPSAGTPAAVPPLFVEAEKPWILIKNTAPERAAKNAGEYPFAVAGESFIPAALAGTANGEQNRVCVIAYNFPASDAPLDFSARALASDGRARGNLDVRLVRSSDGEHGGARKLLLEVVPHGLDPGRYALAVRVQDRRSGQFAESSSPFDVR